MDLVYIHPKHPRSNRKFSLRHGLLRFDPINPNRRGWIEVRDWGFGYGWTIHLAWLSITFGDMDGFKFAGDCDLDRAIPFYGYLRECWIPKKSAVKVSASLVAAFFVNKYCPQMTVDEKKSETMKCVKEIAALMKK